MKTKQKWSAVLTDLVNDGEGWQENGCWARVAECYADTRRGAMIILKRKLGINGVRFDEICDTGDSVFMKQRGAAIGLRIQIEY